MSSKNKAPKLRPWQATYETAKLNIQQNKDLGPERAEVSIVIVVVVLVVLVVVVVALVLARS